ncbi:unnamed protein product [Schistosoma curassoni]|uniref:NADH dehydrogenase subunit 4L n=1 Tax=Schistosoma curassoni TaxID=6186 RepID=A0A183JWJ3_9TREM|nr:unnamed protein product [Schistosoma curassoni]
MMISIINFTGVILMTSVMTMVVVVMWIRNNCRQR